MIVDSLRTDMLRSIRSLLRAPGFSLLVISTLGLAMAANLSIFSLLDRLVLRPLPVEKPGELVIVNAPPIQATGSSVSGASMGPGGQLVRCVSYPLYMALRDLRVFQSMAVQCPMRATMLAGSEPAL
jgi:hypothetical protein